jgi:hypothetical protein
VIKSIDPERQVSWHLWHTITYDPIFRAQTDYSIHPESADWIKPAIYHACGAMRMRSRLIEPHAHRLWRDLDPAALTKVYYAILGLHEKPYEEMMSSRFSSRYVYDEVRRIAAATGGRLAICPGIDIDIPDQDPDVRSGPQNIKEVLKATFDAGARGFVLSRKYSEMRLANLRAAGEFLREARG